MNEKGMMEYDIIVAVVLFLAAYVVTMRTAIYPMVRTERTTDPYQHGNTLLTQMLIQSPGEPEDWNDINEVQTLGLSHHDKGNSPNILDIEKLEAIDGVECEVLRDKLPTDTSVKIRIDSDGGPYECIGEIWTPERRKESVFYVWNGTDYAEGRGTIRVW